MKVLFMGGAGNISTASSRLAVERGIDLYLLNRGRSGVNIDGAKSIVADITKPHEVRDALGDQTFDVVVNWIAFTPDDVQRDIELFLGRTRQYIFISSASAYQSPLSFPITESTPLKNPHWQYSRNKIACEDALHRAWREQDFPMTIVRPSLTYDTVIPVPFAGWRQYTIVDRMKRGKKIVVHGDGTSLWTITHSDDFAKAFVGLLGHQQALGHAFHITSDEVLTWDMIYSALGAAAGVEPQIVHVPSDLIAAVDAGAGAGLLGDKAACGIFDNAKIKKFVPDFVATIPFARGIRRTLDWFEADPQRMVISDADNELLNRILAVYGKAFPDAL